MLWIIHNHMFNIIYSPGWPKVVHKNGNVVFCGLHDTIYVYRKLIKDQKNAVNTIFLTRTAF